MVDLYGINVGKYTFRPMDRSCGIEILEPVKWFFGGPWKRRRNGFEDHHIFKQFFSSQVWEWECNSIPLSLSTLIFNPSVVIFNKLYLIVNKACGWSTLILRHCSLPGWQPCCLCWSHAALEATKSQQYTLHGSNHCWTYRTLVRGWTNHSGHCRQELRSCDSSGMWRPRVQEQV